MRLLSKMHTVIYVTADRVRDQCHRTGRLLNLALADKHSKRHNLFANWPKNVFNFNLIVPKGSFHK
jgi:hypothetical protein